MTPSFIRTVKSLSCILLLIFLSVGCGSQGSTSSGEGGNLSTIKGIATAGSTISFKANPKGFKVAAASGTVPVPGAVCTIEGTDKSTTTDENGLFQITDVAAGSYIIICKKTAADGKVYAFLKIVEVQNDEKIDLGTVEIKKTGSIQGKATLADQTDHTGISIFIPGTSMQARTDALGAYLINEVPEGTYELRFEKSGYITVKITDLPVTSGETAHVEDMILSLSTGASGIISIENGKVYSSSRTVTVYITASDDAKLYQMSDNPNFIGAAWNIIPPSRTWIFDSDGEKRLYIKFADANGLESAPVSDSIIIDTTPPVSPVLTDINVSTTATTANITWKTDKLTIGQVDFGLSQDYGLTIKDLNLANSHTIVLTNLIPLTHYHYQITSIDVAGNTAISSDLRLTTSIFIAIAAGYDHTCALTTSGGAKCWGRNREGQLGDGTTDNRYTPVDVIGLSSGVTAIAAWSAHTCALTTWGGVKCWGSNGDGRLGDGTTITRYAPVDVVGLSSGVTAIAAGGNYTCALTTSGGVKCWGNNNYGQLGDGTYTYRYIAVGVVGLSSGVTAIAAGEYHTCALTTLGGVKCWGYNNYGQLGSTDSSGIIPVDVIGLSSGVTAIAAGQEHTCALTTSGGVKCWGNNGSGRLGDGTIITRYAPVDVVGLSSGVTAISAGGNHTCALTTSGGVKCWGGNGGGGQLGDGTTANRYTPVDVIGLSSGVTAISAGEAHTCILTDLGGGKCWGNNGDGQLGDGTTTNHSTPVDVVGLY